MGKKCQLLINFVTMKRQCCFLFLMLSFLLLACTDHSEEGSNRKAFHNEVVLKTTPVKDQGRGPLCWLYAMLATIETERLQKGDSVNLSPDYPARLWLQDQARTYYLTRGMAKVSMRGMATTALRLTERYGMEPYDSYHPFEGVSYNSLTRMAMLTAKASPSLNKLNQRIGDNLDRTIGFLPPSLFMLGIGYTPQQFAESVYLKGDYAALTSFTHHPFGSSFVLESPDNCLQDTFYNMPIDRMMAVVINSLRRGHPVCWEGDVSEPGFSFSKGVAILPDEDHKVTQQERQRAFERFQTTDDHCMELCGLARDRDGRRFFIAKSSWGTDNPYGGFMYLSDNYVRLKTIAVVVKHGI